MTKKHMFICMLLILAMGIVQVVMANTLSVFSKANHSAKISNFSESAKREKATESITDMATKTPLDDCRIGISNNPVPMSHALSTPERRLIFSVDATIPLHKLVAQNICEDAKDDGWEYRTSKKSAPEPGSLAVISIGLMGMLGFAVKKR